MTLQMIFGHHGIHISEKDPFYNLQCPMKNKNVSLCLKNIRNIKAGTAEH